MCSQLRHFSICWTKAEGWLRVLQPMWPAWASSLAPLSFLICIVGTVPAHSTSVKTEGNHPTKFLYQPHLGSLHRRGVLPTATRYMPWHRMLGSLHTAVSSHRECGSPGPMGWLPYSPFTGARGQQEVKPCQPPPGPRAHVYDCLFQSKKRGEIRAIKDRTTDQ